MKPSDVKLFRHWVPLGDTFGRAEREAAAAFIVQTCVDNGDEWRPVTWKQIGKAMLSAFENHWQWKQFKGNPFFRPDVHDLIAKGFARWVGEADEDGDRAVEFTELGFSALQKAT